MTKMSGLRLIMTLVLSGLMTVSMMAERITESDAAAVANAFMNPASSSSAKRVPAKRMVLKKAAATNESLYYVYENADGEGWVMVAANDVLSPILAYSETGHFRTDNMPVNVKSWLDKYDRFIQKIEADGATASEETTEEWESLRKGIRRAKGDAVVGPLVKTQWDQDAPYNDLCPGTGSDKAYTGCVATAMAQVMNYWQWPVKGTGSRTYTPMDPNSDSGAASKRYGQQTANFGNTTYDWANMKKKHYTSDTQAQKTAIATLMFHCGVATDMMYGNDADGGSGTYTVNYGDWDWSTSEGECAQNALYMFFGYKKATGYMRDGYTYYGTKYYDKWSDADWTAMVKGELDKNRPIMYAGAGSAGGHSFICDGYDDAGYFHFNWGWSGSNDGYYKLSKLAPGSGGAGGGSYDFSEDQDVIIGIEPNIQGHTVITNGTGCSISCASVIENNKALTATITPTDATYDFTSLSVKLGSSTLSENTHYTLSSDKKTLEIKASAITGDVSNNLTITVVWTKNRYIYEMLGEHCTPEEAEGVLEKNAALNLTIKPESGYTLADVSCWEVEMGGTMLTYGSGFTYNASNSTFSIAKVTGDVVILASAGKQVAWMANGTNFATTMTSSDKYVLPTTTPDIECDGKVFVGWCAIENYSSETDAPTFVKEGETANKGTIFYAVFATKGAGGAAENTTYTFTSKSWADATGSWSSQKDGAGYTDGQGVQITTGYSGAGAKTTKSFSDVSKVVVNYCTNSRKGAGSIKITIGDVAKTIDVTKSGGTTLRDLEFAFEKVSGKAAIEVTCGTNSIYINSITITTGGGASYSNYSTTCTPPCVGELTGITLNTTTVKTVFTEGDTFDYDGLVVTANFDGCASKTVKPTNVSAPDMNQVGKQEVTVTYEGKTAKYEITVNALPTYTVRFFSRGTQVGEAQTVKQGHAATKPATDPTACGGYTFACWYTASLPESNTEKPSYVTDFTTTQDQDYYAVFSMTEEDESGQGSNSTFEAKKQGYANGADAGTKEIDGVKYAFDAGMNTHNSPKYYYSSECVHLYPNNTLTISAESAISSIEFTFIRDDGWSANPGTWDETTNKWTGDAKSVTFTVNSTTGYQVRISKIAVTIGSGSSSITYYTTQPSCEACTAAVNVIKGTAANGSFSLDKEGEQSTCGGKLVVTVSGIEPATGYRFKAITQTGIEDATIDQAAKTVTYKKKVTGTSTINVEFEAIPQYTIRFYNNGAQIGNDQLVYEDGQPAVPSNPTPACSKYTFAGWYTAELAEDNTEAKTWISNFSATKDQDYYAVYKNSIEEGSDPVNTTYTFTTKGWKDATNSWTSNKEGNQLTTGQGVQVTTGVTGAGATTKSAIENVSKVVVRYCTNKNDGAGSIKVTVGDKELNKTVSKADGTTLRDLEFGFNKFSGKVSLKVTCTTNSIYIYSVTITAGGKTVTTYYTTSVDCTATGIEEVRSETTDVMRSEKVIIDGQLYILYNNNIYTITGTRIK